ncbi:hypothetical protein [Candidatus Thiosymbion oneisti]|uniref:hypothetical protein n=1 Tax=Candidatus Thiosymbion oneisti TaxID=589554 RepID=UPI00105D9539|nr:hypothetical protein [Candidatus Thiosymbion oneisti]
MKKFAQAINLSLAIKICVVAAVTNIGLAACTQQNNNAANPTAFQEAKLTFWQKVFAEESLMRTMLLNWQTLSLHLDGLKVRNLLGSWTPPEPESNSLYLFSPLEFRDIFVNSYPYPSPHIIMPAKAMVYIRPKYLNDSHDLVSIVGTDRMGNVACHIFHNWISVFSLTTAYRGIPKFAQTMTHNLSSNPSVLATGLVVSVNGDFFEVLELHYAKDATILANPIFVSKSTFNLSGMKVAESDVIGQKEKDYFFIWPTFVWPTFSFGS